MDSEWVDFKKVKEAVNMEMILAHYSVSGLKAIRDELRGPCPIHKASKQSKNFTVNVRKNGFKCFAKECGAHGNVLDFVAAIEKCSIREAALKLRDWFKVGDRDEISNRQAEESETFGEVMRGIYQDEGGSLYEVVIPNAMSEELASVVVVYRALFGDYQYCVASPENFVQSASSVETTFKLVRLL
jgi:hypothetical protein